MSLRAVHTLAENATRVLDRIVAAMRADGIDIDLSASTAPEDADLLLACGLLTIEMIHGGHEREIVAAPHFPGERGGLYRSMVVAPSAISLTDAAAATMAVNEYGSWSGWHGYVAWLAGAGLEPTGERVLTGSHLASADAVRDGTAEVAAIDATIWRELVDQTGLTVVGTTDDWPAPPISIATELDDETIHLLHDSLRRSGFVDDADDEDYRFMLAARTNLS